MSWEIWSHAAVSTQERTPRESKTYSVNSRRIQIVARTAGSHDLDRGLGPLALLKDEEVADAEDGDPDHDAGDYDTGDGARGELPAVVGAVGVVAVQLLPPRTVVDVGHAVLRPLLDDRVFVLDRDVHHRAGLLAERVALFWAAAHGALRVLARYFYAVRILFVSVLHGVLRVPLAAGDV